MNWIPLTTEQQLLQLREKSHSSPQVIFKHSTRCSISSMVLDRLERSQDVPANAAFYYLDLIAHRPLSNQVSELFQVYHESPQVLVIRDGECVYDESHMGIRMGDIAENL